MPEKYNIKIDRNVSPAVHAARLEAIEKMGIAKLVAGVEKEESTEEFADSFQGIGKMPGKYNIRIDRNVSPAVYAARKFPNAIMKIFNERLYKLEKEKIIIKEEGPTEWVNSLVVVGKKGGDFRICMDPSELNKAIRREHFYIPTISICIPYRQFQIHLFSVF
ncbi:uncharacterized protein LOC123322358 [Coccinella septempunctata]|uniref:uncharacterized protein LOC123322358 n=1 Tax=Coccinella septempunctata TaxID=41139 RepID=UPI001D098C57|nr:uncharacterized protein LOC123322358 [Coccinella septempunctata]